MIRYILLGATFYLVFLFVTLPANIVYAYWQEYLSDNTPVILTGVEGSIWSGRASSAVINNQKLQMLEWSFQPLSLLLGKVEVDWEVTVPDGQGKGSAGISLINGFFLNNVNARLPAKLIASYANAAALNPAGMVTISMNDIATDGKNITAANGTIGWQKAAVTVFKPMELGNYEVILSQEGDIINGLLKDKGGPLEADGKLTLSPEGEYEFNGTLSIRDAGRQDLRQALQSMGRPDRSGKIKISRKGNLSQLGLGN